MVPPYLERWDVLHMSTSRAFRVTFTAAVLIGLIDWAIPHSVAQQTFYVGTSLGYLILSVFGFLAGREGSRYRHVFLHTWAFVALWFLLGVVNLILDRGETPADWSPEHDLMAFYGYLLASAVFLPVAFASSGLGVAVARLVSRRRHEPPPAA